VVEYWTIVADRLRPLGIKSSVGAAIVVDERWV